MIIPYEYLYGLRNMSTYLALGPSHVKPSERPHTSSWFRLWSIRPRFLKTVASLSGLIILS